MRRLELRQGLSYAVKGFSCVKGVPFDVDDDAARRLLSTGRFEELPVADDDAGGTDSDGSMGNEELSADRIAKLKKPELEALAAERNIDISGCNNNEERAAKICGVLGLVGMVQMGLEI